MKSYCTQNDGDCSSCSLVSYGRDCQNNPVWGGRRAGAGRPSTGRSLQRIYATDEEMERLREYLEELRK